MSFSSGSRFHFRTSFVFREKYRNLLCGTRNRAVREPSVLRVATCTSCVLYEILSGTRNRAVREPLPYEIRCCTRAGAVQDPVLYEIPCGTTVLKYCTQSVSVRTQSSNMYFMLSVLSHHIGYTWTMS
jgi:hypothetical protein